MRGSTPGWKDRAGDITGGSSGVRRESDAVDQDRERVGFMPVHVYLLLGRALFARLVMLQAEVVRRLSGANQKRTCALEQTGYDLPTSRVETHSSPVS